MPRRIVKRNETGETKDVTSDTSVSQEGADVKTRSPFKDIEELEKEVIAFANKFKTTVADQAKRISDYFEMSCFNYVVHFYELHGYNVTPENLQGGVYRYKCSTAGIQSNFSHFQATYRKGSRDEYEIHHNLAIQSCHDGELFTTPDISVIKKGSIKFKTDYYDTKRVLSYAYNNDTFSFCEAKQMNPFPELLFNFIGVINELRKDIIENASTDFVPVHIAPSLMISGKPSKPVGKIKESLEGRYCINIIFDMFYSAAATFSYAKIGKLRKAGKLKT